MGLWYSIRREVTGAWRSVRYDVHRHRGIHRATKLRRAVTAEFTPEVIRRPRPIAAATGVALLVAGGAAGTYLAVAGALTASRPAGPPVAAPAAPLAPAPTKAQSPTPKRATGSRQGRRPAPAPVEVLPPVPAPDPTPSNPPERIPESAAVSPSPSPSVTPSSTPSASPYGDPAGR